jgi:hypothetical protein
VMIPDDSDAADNDRGATINRAMAMRDKIIFMCIL